MKSRLIHEIRAIKSKAELENIIKAQNISEDVLQKTLKYLKTGITELEVVKFIEKEFIKNGSDILAFEPIVAFGKGSADVHHIPNKTKLKKSDFVMFDFGCTVNGYCSDMTRTYFFGKPERRQMKVYGDVLTIQERVIKALEKGERRAKVLDKIARVPLQKKYGVKKFPHGLGHGVGTVIHEWPNLKPNSPDILPIGCVITVEPGLYFKGWGGVRIEDMILVTKDGCKNLTKTPKSLEKIVLPVK